MLSHWCGEQSARAWWNKWSLALQCHKLVQRSSHFPCYLQFLELKLAVWCANLHQHGCLPECLVLLGMQLGEGVRFVPARVGPPSPFQLSGGCRLNKAESQTSHLPGHLVWVSFNGIILELFMTWNTQKRFLFGVIFLAFNLFLRCRPCSQSRPLWFPTVHSHWKVQILWKLFSWNVFRIFYWTMFQIEMLPVAFHTVHNSILTVMRKIICNCSTIAFCSPSIFGASPWKGKIQIEEGMQDSSNKRGMTAGCDLRGKMELGKLSKPRMAVIAECASCL